MCTLPRARVRKVREPGGLPPPPREALQGEPPQTQALQPTEKAVCWGSPGVGAPYFPTHWAPTALQGLGFLSRGSGPIVSDQPGHPDACSGKEGGLHSPGWKRRRGLDSGPQELELQVGGRWEGEGDGVFEWGWTLGQGCPWSRSSPSLSFPPTPALTAPSVCRRGHFAPVTQRDRRNRVAAEAQADQQAPPDCTWGGRAGRASLQGNLGDHPALPEPH